VERVLLILGAIKRLETKFIEANDPRDKLEIAETLDLLALSLDYEVDRISQVKSSGDDKGESHELIQSSNGDRTARPTRRAS